MSRDDESREAFDAAEDRRIRDALQRSAPRSPPDHGRRVLAAAREASESIGRERREAGGDSSPGARARRWFVPLSAAAGILLAVTAIVGNRTMVDPPVDVLRGAGSVTKVTPEHESTLRGVPPRFAWPAEPGAASYTLTLMDASAALLWVSERQADTELRVPDEVADLLARDGTYLWTVSVEGGTGAATLGPYWFRRIAAD